MPQNFRCFLYGRDFEKSWCSDLVGRSRSLSGLFLRRRNRNSCSLYRQNAFFDHSGRCGACKKQKMQDRVSGRMYDREKTNRSPSYGTESTWRGCPGKCIRLDGECVRFEGQDIVFPKSSVGAAQQAILAAVLAKGVTHLYNCAKEPEVFWLCRYLKTMGALIEGEETGEITIRGVDELKGGDYRIPPDRIVAGTYLCAAAAARSKIILHDVPVEELQSFMEVYRKIGGQYQVNGGTLEVNGKNAVRPAVLVETEIYPGFPTDLQAPLMAVLTGAQGQSTIRENIFDRRFGSAFQMKKWAQIFP